MKINSFNVLKNNSNTADQLCRALFTDLAGDHAIIATGGYGRGLLAPFSDIDVLILGHKKAPVVLPAMWDQKQKISPLVLSLDDAATLAAEDQMALTSFMRTRLIAGSKTLYKNFTKTIEKVKTGLAFGRYVREKLAERDMRHERLGGSRYVLEPNIKDGKGDLRDLQTLGWIADYLYDAPTPAEMKEKGLLSASEAARFVKSEEFLWSLRIALHDITGRKEDRLTFDLQPALARHFGYEKPEEFMKQVFLVLKDVGSLTRTICAAMEADSIAMHTAGSRQLVLESEIEGFPVSGNRLLLPKKGGDAVKLFRVSQSSGVDIHPDALRKLELPEAHDPEGLATFVEILLDKGAENTLRHMSEAGVLGALLPDFGQLIAHMQYDMYHVYTADEHILRAVGMMHALEEGKLARVAPLATEIFPAIKSRRAAYVAMFLHDIAKGRGGDHSGKGAEIARALCPKLGLSAEETDTVAWLVQEHLLMTMTAFKRDLDDPKAIAAFVEQVQSPERLRLLLALTVADINATGPDRWTAWKAAVLDKLYHAALRQMQGEPPQAQERPAPADMPEISIEIGKAATEVTVCTRDRKGLFADLAGAIAASGGSVTDARIHTWPDGMVQDVFQVQDLNGAPYENEKHLRKMIKAAIDGKLDIKAELAGRHARPATRLKQFRVAPRVFTDAEAATDNTMIEVNGKDRPGLLYDLASALAAMNVQISAARVATFGSKAIDVFYVRDAFGLKITQAQALEDIRTTLLTVLEKE